jgi:hypothetical protein
MRLLAEIALVVVAAVGVAVCLALLPDAVSGKWRHEQVPEPPRPEQLVALERLVTLSASSALQVHAYLRPLLVEIAAQRLAAHGQALERLPESVGQELLGDGLWEIVRPSRPFPEDRHGPGIPPDELQAMLETLERL